MAVSTVSKPELSDEEKGLVFRLNNTLRQYPATSPVRNRILKNILENDADISYEVKLTLASTEFRTPAGAMWGYKHLNANSLRRLVATTPFTKKHPYHKILLENPNLDSRVVEAIIIQGGTVYAKDGMDEAIEFLLAVDESLLPLDLIGEILARRNPVKYSSAMKMPVLLNLLRQKFSYPDDIPDEWIIDIIVGTNDEESKT